MKLKHKVKNSLWVLKEEEIPQVKAVYVYGFNSDTPSAIFRRARSVFAAAEGDCKTWTEDTLLRAAIQVAHEWGFSIVQARLKGNVFREVPRYFLDGDNDPETR